MDYDYDYLLAVWLRLHSKVLELEYDYNYIAKVIDYIYDYNDVGPPMMPYIVQLPATPKLHSLSLHG